MTSVAEVGPASGCHALVCRCDHSIAGRLVFLASAARPAALPGRSAGLALCGPRHRPPARQHEPGTRQVELVPKTSLAMHPHRIVAPQTSMPTNSLPLHAIRYE